jgi:hypothetical protein
VEEICRQAFSSNSLLEWEIPLGDLKADGNTVDLGNRDPDKSVLVFDLTVGSLNMVLGRMFHKRHGIS